MTWEIWKVGPSGKILDIERFGDDSDAARMRFADIGAAREAGCWELRKDGVYVSLFSLTEPERKP